MAKEEPGTVQGFQMPPTCTIRDPKKAPFLKVSLGLLTNKPTQDL